MDIGSGHLIKSVTWEEIGWGS